MRAKCPLAHGRHAHAHVHGVREREGPSYRDARRWSWRAVMETEPVDVSALAVYLRECHAAMGSPSIREVARKTGLSHGGVHAMLTGRVVPRPANLARMVAYLGADPATASRLADESRPAERAPRAPRMTLRTLCAEVAALREAVENLTNTKKNAG